MRPVKEQATSHLLYHYIMSWELPQATWKRLHGDYAGPYEGNMFFKLVDAYSKWVEVVPMSAATSTATSVKFKAFMENNEIRHLCCPPYQPPSTHGLAEHSVQSFRRAMERTKIGQFLPELLDFIQMNTSLYNCFCSSRAFVV